MIVVLLLLGCESMDANELADRIHSLYGDVDWPRATGRLHVVAIAGSNDAVLAIGPDAPASSTDRFVLGLARARATLILTTGVILRAEPTTTHCYAEDAATDEAFARWRRDVLGFSHRPRLLVLSRSGDLPADHPALRIERGGMVWTSKGGRDLLGSSVGRLSVEAGLADGHSDEDFAKNLGSLLRAAGARFDDTTVLIEAGPTLSNVFYRASSPDCPPINELLLSRFEGDAAEEAMGPHFEANSNVAEQFGEPMTHVRVSERSGPWVFERYRSKVAR